MYICIPWIKGNDAIPSIIEKICVVVFSSCNCRMTKLANNLTKKFKENLLSKILKDSLIKMIN